TSRRRRRSSSRHSRGRPCNPNQRCRPRWRHDHHCTNNQIGPVRGGRSVAPNLLHCWRHLLSEGGAAAASSDEPVVGSSEVNAWRRGCASWNAYRKTMENEILREALAKSQARNLPCCRSCCEGRFSVKRMAEELGVSRSNLVDMLRSPGVHLLERRGCSHGLHNRRTRPRGVTANPDHAALIEGRTMKLSASHPALRRRAANLRPPSYHWPGELGTDAQGLPVANPKRVHRIMRQGAMLLEPYAGRREGRVHDEGDGHALRPAVAAVASSWLV